MIFVPPYISKPSEQYDLGVPEGDEVVSVEGDMILAGATTVTFFALRTTKGETLMSVSGEPVFTGKPAYDAALLYVGNQAVVRGYVGTAIFYGT
jgi:hypothetical protein